MYSLRKHFLILFFLPLSLHASSGPATVLVLDKSQFVGRHFFTVADAIRGLTALNVERLGGRQMLSKVKVRATSNNSRVLVMMDGRPLNPDFDGQVDLSQIPIAIVDRIEITMGGAPFLYSSESIAGSIQIVTLRPQQEGLDVSLGTLVGRHGTTNATGQFTGRSNLGDLTYVSSQEDLSGFADNEDAFQNNHFGNISRSFNGKGFWGLEYFFHEARRGQTSGTPVEFDEWNGKLEKQSINNFAEQNMEWQALRANVQSPETSLGTFHASVAGSQWDDELKSTESGPITNDKKNQTVWGHVRSEMNNFIAAADYRETKYDQFNDNKLTRSQAGLFSSYRLVTSSWTLTPSIRIDRTSSLGAFAAPRISLFREQRHWTFSSSIGRSQRLPSVEELFVSSQVISNPSLDVEKAWTIDVGAVWQKEPVKRLALSTFFTRVTDSIIASNATSQWTNEGTEHNAGVECHGRWPLSETLITTGHLNAQASRIKNGDGKWLQSPMTPTFQGRLVLDWQIHPTASISNEVEFKSSQYERAARQGQRVAGYGVWNARFNVKILQADLFVEIDNILKKRYAESISDMSALYPQAVRTYWAGAAIRFYN